MPVQNRRLPAAVTPSQNAAGRMTLPGTHVFVAGVSAPPRRSGDRTTPSGAAIRVFLVSDFELLRQGLAELMSNRRGQFALVGWSSQAGKGASPWGTLKPDVVLLDLAVLDEPDAIVAWVARLVADERQRVLLLSYPDRASLQSRALLAGACGVIERTCPYEQMLTALAHVHRGDLWLDTPSSARLLQHMAQLGSTRGHTAAEAVLQRLSERERHILQVLLRHAAAPAKTLAQQLAISESTLRNHLTSIYGKLGVRNRNGLLFHAMTHGLGQQRPDP